MVLRDPWLVAAAIAATLAVVQTARLWWLRGAARRALRTRARRGAEGERAAEGLLAREGYRVIDRQVDERLELRVDGEPVAIALRADLIVRRGGRSFVAEVKTGEVAPRIEHPATRRQLLEYRHAFSVDGVLLVDMEEGRVREVDFGPPRTGSRPLSLWTIRVAWLVAGGALGGYFASGLSP